jgi:hypothetical protein
MHATLACLSAAAPTLSMPMNTCMAKVVDGKFVAIEPTFVPSMFA